MIAQIMQVIKSVLTVGTVRWMEFISGLSNWLFPVVFTLCDYMYSYSYDVRSHRSRSSGSTLILIHYVSRRLYEIYWRLLFFTEIVYNIFSVLMFLQLAWKCIIQYNTIRLTSSLAGKIQCHRRPIHTQATNTTIWQTRMQRESPN